MLQNKSRFVRLHLQTYLLSLWLLFQGGAATRFGVVH